MMEIVLIRIFLILIFVYYITAFLDVLGIFVINKKQTTTFKFLIPFYIWIFNSKEEQESTAEKEIKEEINKEQ